MNLKTSQNGIDLLIKLEGFSPKAYKDVVGKWTAGIGKLIDTPEEQYLKTAILTKEQAIELLKKDLLHFEKGVNDNVKSAINQNQFDALVCFVYNLGVGSLETSTLLKLINANPNDPLIRKEFMKWCYAGGKIVKGLVHRRLNESELYFKK